MYGSSEFTGIKMRDLRDKKGLAQLCHFVMALRTKGVSKELAMIATLWMQLISGISVSVFEDVETVLLHLYPIK